MASFDKTVAAYDYEYPEALIGQAPARPRDAARLLAYDRTAGQATIASFRELPQLLPPRSVLVFNRTRVLPARLPVTKPTGGRVELLYLKTEADHVEVMANRRLAVGSRLQITPRLKLTVTDRPGKHYWLKPEFPIGRWPAVLQKHGQTPLPPYIKHSPLSEKQRRREYQTVFAKDTGSVAAPTASLHFTRRLMRELRAAGHDLRYLILHVGLGTFAPLTPEQLASQQLHEEQYWITSRTANYLNRAKAAGRPIIPVGTTACRALESAASPTGELTELAGSTRLFISPGYQFRVTDGLITNFHVPKSSLMMLVAALTGRTQLLKLYRQAISAEFRLFSFGDGMLIR
jgi:S-adenosylmethionine:tRNA ribosyltransferase-isomerase